MRSGLRNERQVTHHRCRRRTRGSGEAQPVGRARRACRRRAPPPVPQWYPRTPCWMPSL
jgi:hypothetical protein